MLDTYNKQAHPRIAITILAGISSRNHYFIVEQRNNIKYKERMIAKIYPDNHPDLQGKKDPTHPVRYFDIRKLTPTECYRLMGVPQAQIEKLMATEKRPYVAFVGVDRQLEVLGLEPSATGKEVADAYEDAMRDYNQQREEAQRFIDQGYQDPATRPAKDDEGEDIIYGYKTEEEYGTFLRKAQDELEANELYAANLRQAYQAICDARTEQRYGDVQVISNSSHYKLAGNSIVCDVLMYIYEEFLYPTGRRLKGEVTDLFAQPQFVLKRDWLADPLRVVTLCSGYDSQCIAFQMLQERHPDFRFELKAWAEFDPESKRPLNEQPAVVAHNLLFPQWDDLADADIDLLTYSTPCQSISQAGKREGIKKGSDTRSAVLWYTEEAVRTMRPKVLLQENVRALINQVNMPDFREWCQLLESHGYVNFLAPSFPIAWSKDKRERKTVPGILNAKHYGVAQNRERVYMISVRADVLGDTQYKFPRPFELQTCIADILEEGVSEKFFLKPDSVIKFLSKNETKQRVQCDARIDNAESRSFVGEANEADQQAQIYYEVTDHKLSREEIEHVRQGGHIAG